MDARVKTAARKGETGRSRPRASLACMTCRQRKIKCQNLFDSDSCVSCRSLRVPCVLNKDGDRRKAGSRQHVVALQERLDQLESYIASGQRGDDQDSHPQSNVVSDAGKVYVQETDGSGSPYDRQRSLPTSAPSTDSRSRGSEVSPLQTAEDLLSLRNSLGAGSAGPANISSASPRTGVGGLTPPTSDQGAGRLELDEVDGRPIHYGPTSQAHIQRHSISVESNGPVPFGQRLGLDIDSEPLRTMLFRTFWTIQPRSQVVVDETLFHRDRCISLRTEYHSSFLENGLLACATRLSTSQEVRSLGARYAERAKAEIVQELEAPNTATLQGFLLLSDFEATRGRDRLGYLYAGIGCRLVWDLGLPESCDALIADGKLSISEASTRHTLLLGAFVYDKTWSLYLGRPGQIPTSIVGAAYTRAVTSGWSGPSTIGPWVGLCSEMSEVTGILNSSASIDAAGRHRLADLDTRIHRRHCDLPPSVTAQKGQLASLPAEAYSLHIQFHGLRIILNRLLYKAISLQTDGAGGIQHHEILTANQSRLCMYQNAMDVAQLVSVYLQIFGVEQVITIMLDNSFVAAAVLISHALGTQQVDPNANVEQELYHLRALADLLARAQKHYPVTLRMRCTLSSYVEKSTMAGLFGDANSHQAHPVNGASGSIAGQQFQQSRGNTSNNDFLALGQDMTGRDEVAMFQDFGGDIFQQMDMANMMSWALSPSAMRPDLPYYNM